MSDIQSGFHWRDGWYFKRLEDGSVRVSHVTHPPFEGKLEQQFVIPADPQKADEMAFAQIEGKVQ